MHVLISLMNDVQLVELFRCRVHFQTDPDTRLVKASDMYPPPCHERVLGKPGTDSKHPWDMRSACRRDDAASARLP